MLKHGLSKSVLLIFIASSVLFTGTVKAEHPFNGSYTGRNLDRIAFPIGGFGSGMFCLEGNASISHMSVMHHMDFFNEPVIFAAVCVKGKTVGENCARVLEGPIPDYKYFGRPGSGNCSVDHVYGLPRFTQCEFKSRFPLCDIRLHDSSLPLDVTVTGFSPFIPGEADLSSYPAGSLDYSLTNTTSEPLELVFSLHSRNFMRGDCFGELKNGIRIPGPEGEFALAIQGDWPVHADYCWFRGGWFDLLSITWNNIQQGVLIDNPPVENNAPGASLFVPVTLAPNETRTVRVLVAWFVPESGLVCNNFSTTPVKLDEKPAPGTADHQSRVTGYHGKGLVNTYYPAGDAHIGEIYSPEFHAGEKYLHFLIGGGTGNPDTAGIGNVGVSIQRKKEDGTFVTWQTFSGKNNEHLEWVTCPLDSVRDETLRIHIFDFATGPWGHINADDFVLSDLPLDEFLADGSGNVLADFEGADYGNWSVKQQPENSNITSTYAPWYATKFHSVENVLESFDSQYDQLRHRSELFARTLEKSTLPPEVMEAVEANLTILKSPTILRQQDGRLWGWEGNQDTAGSCPGTCTHVWNYTQSLCHLFPGLERTFRQTEFHESLTEDGRQAFRSNLPASPGGIEWDASDGQLGTIMRLYREWRISGSEDFLKEYWPPVKKSIDFCIRTWDPDETGLLEKSHHNTYDIDYLGPEGHCGSFYLGALAAVIKMGEFMNDDVSRYRSILEKGRRRMETELFNGEYFIQKTPAPGNEAAPESQSEYYRRIAEQINAQGPKYQYGNGCLSDGVLGFWMAKVCGIDDDIVNPEMIRSHLNSVYRYNYRKDLSEHANPQRSGYALGNEGGLLLCSWPHHDKPLLPFVYSDEVWTGIEYQVASHLMMIGETEKGLDIVKTCRKRYDGIRRNPFNEYECGHWYARAMSSFALLQGMTGVRYDAVSGTLYFRVTEQDYTVPVFTENGYGTVHFDAGKKSVSIDIVEGKIDVVTTAATNPD